jgi:hypothetical protein
VSIRMSSQQSERAKAVAARAVKAVRDVAAATVTRLAARA